MNNQSFKYTHYYLPERQAKRMKINLLCPLCNIKLSTIPEPSHKFSNGLDDPTYQERHCTNCPASYLWLSTFTYGWWGYHYNILNYKITMTYSRGSNKRSGYISCHSPSYSFVNLHNDTVFDPDFSSLQSLSQQIKIYAVFG